MTTDSFWPLCFKAAKVWSYTVILPESVWDLWYFDWRSWYLPTRHCAPHRWKEIWTQQELIRRLRKRRRNEILCIFSTSDDETRRKPTFKCVHTHTQSWGASLYILHVCMWNSCSRPVRLLKFDQGQYQWLCVIQWWWRQRKGRVISHCLHQPLDRCGFISQCKSPPCWWKVTKE